MFAAGARKSLVGKRVGRLGTQAGHFCLEFFQDGSSHVATFGESAKNSGTTPRFLTHPRIAEIVTFSVSALGPWPVPVPIPDPLPVPVPAPALVPTRVPALVPVLAPAFWHALQPEPWHCLHPIADFAISSSFIAASSISNSSKSCCIWASCPAICRMASAACSGLPCFIDCCTVAMSSDIFCIDCVWGCWEASWSSFCCSGPTFDILPRRRCSSICFRRFSMAC